MKADEAPIGHRVDQDVGDGCGLGQVETGAQPAEVGDAADDGAGAVASLLVGGGEQRGGVGIGVGGDDEDLVERGEPPGDAGVHRHPCGEQGGGVLLLHQPLHLGPVGDGDRFVVPGERPVEGQLQDGGLPAHRGEHRPAADPGPLGDGVDRGRHVPPLHEELGPGVDDPTSGDPGLLVTERRPVRARGVGHGRVPSERVAPIDCTDSVINIPSV